MSDTKLMMAVAKSLPNLILLSLSLLWTYFTLGWRVSKARRAFEAQLMAQGMSKQNAQQLSLFYDDLKNNITATIKQGIAGGLMR